MSFARVLRSDERTLLELVSEDQFWNMVGQDFILWFDEDKTDSCNHEEQIRQSHILYKNCLHYLT